MKSLRLYLILVGLVTLAVPNAAAARSDVAVLGGTLVIIARTASGMVIAADRRSDREQNGVITLRQENRTKIFRVNHFTAIAETGNDEVYVGDKVVFNAAAETSDWLKTHSLSADLAQSVGPLAELLSKNFAALYRRLQHPPLNLEVGFTISVVRWSKAAGAAEASGIRIDYDPSNAAAGVTHQVVNLAFPQFVGDTGNKFQPALAELHASKDPDILSFWSSIVPTENVAVHFCKVAIRTASKYVSSIGPVADVAAITSSGFRWIQGGPAPTPGPTAHRTRKGASSINRARFLRLVRV